MTVGATPRGCPIDLGRHRGLEQGRHGGLEQGRHGGLEQGGHGGLEQGRHRGLPLRRLPLAGDNNATNQCKIVSRAAG